MKCDEKYFHFGGKAEPKLEGLTITFHYSPLEKLCTKFGAFVRSINIMLKNDAKKLIKSFGYGHKTLNMTRFVIFYFVLMLLILLSDHICLIHIHIKLYH